METTPDRQTALDIYRSGTPQVMLTRLVADLETPVSAYLKLTGNDADSFLLESVEGGAVRGRYTIIGCAPDLIWRCIDGQAEIAENASGRPTDFMAQSEAPLESLRTVLKRSLIDLPDDLPPMAAGLVGYMGYDMVRQMERLGPGKPSPVDVPDGLFLRPTLMAIFDSVSDRISLVTPIRPEPGMSAEDAIARAETRLSNAVERLSGPVPPAFANGNSRLPATPAGGGAETEHTGKARYLDMVEQAKAHMAAGDIFQVVLAQHFSIPFSQPPLALYRALRRLNPSPFLFFLNFADFALVGSSPEILVRLRDGQVTVRPIAGTRPRGKTAEEDAALAESLLNDPKELAEHLMLLDLGRNDAGRVSKPGSVRVTERNIVERYSHVMHIVSNVTGDFDDKRFDSIDALKATFPAGTVSGAPKVRAMEIIDDLEAEGRGPYAGAVGYFAANGSMDTCIVLRTGLVKDGRLHVHAGAGLVADSVPESEYRECVNKARALFRAAEDAEALAAAVRETQPPDDAPAG